MDTQRVRLVVMIDLKQKKYLDRIVKRTGESLASQARRALDLHIAQEKEAKKKTAR